MINTNNNILSFIPTISYSNAGIQRRDILKKQKKKQVFTDELI